MVESLGMLTGSPWIYAVVALSVLLDVFLPLLPSGVLVITAATAAAAGSTTVAVAGAAGKVAQAQVREVPSLLLVMLCAFTASVLGDLVAFRLARRRDGRVARTIARSRRLTTAQERLGGALSAGGGVLVVIARFAPAGRSVVSLSAGVAHRRLKEFLPWSALAAVAWTGYSAGLGYLGGQWLGASWLGTAVSVLALFAAGSLAAYFIRRPGADPGAASPA
ncbi:VTT domain-containing protein [Streptomyces sp. NPDC093109]|uniref:DedA family protein n=1 Tax=Streptomyces sp. NPDC093109 TaxID=3154977 RepID=UPI00344BB7F7